MVPVNFAALLVTTFVSMVLGALWFGPFFGKEWMRLSKCTPEQMAAAKEKGMSKSYGIMAIGSFIMSYVLAHVVVFAGASLPTSGASLGIMVGVLTWIGFIAPVTMGSVLWEGKPWKLWCITSGYYLVSLVIMGTILAVWM